MRWLFACVGFAIFSCSPISFAQSAQVDTHKAALIETLERAALDLPEDKRHRAQSAIDQFKLGKVVSDYSYGWDRADPILKQGGIDALIREAQMPRGALRYAKTDALLAAGVMLGSEDAQGAERLNATLLDMARRADEFEKAVYAHSAAELAAIRCDRQAFESALTLLPYPESLRYRFWGARINGETGRVLADRSITAESDDTRYIRQAIDGYRLIQDFGYCEPVETQIAD